MAPTFNKRYSLNVVLIRMLIAIFLVLPGILSAEILCASWNMKWFPSGRAEHYAPKQKEQMKISTAAEIINNSFSKFNTKNKILFVQEVRDYATFTNLCSKIKMEPAVFSGFRVRNNRRGWQQCAIATTMKIKAQNWCNWKNDRNSSIKIPRGYSYVLLDGGEDGDIECYCIHLKSNYGDKKKRVKAMNKAMRERAAKQLARIIKNNSSKGIKTIVAGDFNTDCFSQKFKDEITLELLEKTGLQNSAKQLHGSEKVTYPGRGKYKDAVFDYILFDKEYKTKQIKVIDGSPISDHNLVLINLD